jgi:hypothetical protein
MGGVSRVLKAAEARRSRARKPLGMLLLTPSWRLEAPHSGAQVPLHGNGATSVSCSSCREAAERIDSPRANATTRRGSPASPIVGATSDLWDDRTPTRRSLPTKRIWVWRFAGSRRLAGAVASSRRVGVRPAPRRRSPRRPGAATRVGGPWRERSKSPTGRRANRRRPWREQQPERLEGYPLRTSPASPIVGVANDL